MKVTRDQIVRAINRMPEAATYPTLGLCFCFGRYTGEVPEYLIALGGKEDWSGLFWPSNIRGRNQRLMFLAFMLTWLEDIENGK